MIYYVDGKGRPARMEMSQMGQTMTVDYKNWTEGAQETSLFEVPAGYNKMPGMGGS
jgi:outer membrane lipoprotein-sorting protein